jgi:hypothetical protein
MPSKTEQVLQAIMGLLGTVQSAGIERNTAVPEKISDGGLMVLRDGDSGEPDTALGGFGGAYYRHAIELEVYIEDGVGASRDAAFDSLLQDIGTALDGDPTLGGLAFGMTYGRPEIDTEAVAGAPAIKTGTITLIIEYEADSPLG